MQISNTNNTAPPVDMVRTMAHTALELCAHHIHYEQTCFLLKEYKSSKDLITTFLDDHVIGLGSLLITGQMSNASIALDKSLSVIGRTRLMQLTAQFTARITSMGITVPKAIDAVCMHFNESYRPSALIDIDDVNASRAEYRIKDTVVDNLWLLPVMAMFCYPEQYVKIRDTAISDASDDSSFRESGMK